MSATRSILTPADVGEAVELSAGVWRKQILPQRKINYNGRIIDFSRKYLAGIADSWKRQAFDQVPAQLATAKNEHNNDPERFRGELADVELASDGLYGIFHMGEDGNKLLKQNPKLGVSARILEGYNRSDGQSFGKAMQHVLLTLDPKVNGLKPWEAVSLSNDDFGVTESLDLSNLQYEEETVGDTKADETEVVTLSAEEYSLFQEMAAQHKAVLEFTNSLPDEDPEEEEEEDDDTAPRTDPVVLATLEAQSTRILELSNSLREKDISVELSQLEATGLAPAIIEAAKPLLALETPEIELSNGDTLDVSGAVRNLLSTIRGMAENHEAYLEFDQEVGLSNDESDPVIAQRNQMLDAWDAISPIS